MNISRSSCRVPFPLLGLVLMAALFACGGPSGGANPGPSNPIDPSGPAPAVVSFVSSGPVFVGDRAALTAVYSGDSADVEGLGPVTSGIPVQTPPLRATTQFTLTVRRAGHSVEATLSVPVGYRNQIRPLADSPVARTKHVAMPLPDGSALVMGGNSSETLNVPDSASSGRFDPAAERFTDGPPLAFTAQDRLFTVALPLPGGAFLLAGGGVNAEFVVGTSAELLSQTFDPAAQAFTRAGDQQVRHSGTGVGASLADGRVLLTGGGTPATRAAEIYDAPTRGWTQTSPMVVGRRSHTATLLQDGRVLIAGGVVCCTVNGNTITETYTDTAELFDPRTGKFQPTGSLSVARGFHQANLLFDGRVLISGGDGAGPAADVHLAQAEVFDPATGEFTPAGVLHIARAFHSSVVLTDGRVLVVGGIGVAAQADVGVPLTEIYDPGQNSWTSGPTLNPAWFSLTATVLGSGKVLLFGGEDAQGFPRASTFLFE